MLFYEYKDIFKMILFFLNKNFIRLFKFFFWIIFLTYAVLGWLKRFLMRFVFYMYLLCLILKNEQIHEKGNFKKLNQKTLIYYIHNSK